MIIEGKNSVLEAVSSDRGVNKLYILQGYTDSTIQKIINMARDRNIKMQFVDKKYLDKLTNNRHQNVVADVGEYQYVEVNDILDYAKARGERLFLIILDGIEDPHNLGSILRSAEVAGAHGIVIPKNRAAGITDSVVRVSAGASQHIKVARVTNINDTIRDLKDDFVKVYAADMKGEYMYNIVLREDIAIVIGGEGMGVKPLTAKLCDGIISIPMRGKVNSLNASVAAGIIMYEVIRQRL